MTEEEVKLITKQLLKDGMIEETEVDGRIGYVVTEKGRQKRMQEKEETYLTVEYLLEREWSYSCIHLVKNPFLNPVLMDVDEGCTENMLCEWCSKRDINELLHEHMIVIFAEDDSDDDEGFIAG